MSKIVDGYIDRFGPSQVTLFVLVRFWDTLAGHGDEIHTYLKNAKGEYAEFS